MTISATERVLPREILVEKTRDGIRFRLPPRRAGKIQLIGLVPLAFGLTFMSVPFFWFAPFLKGVFTNPNWFHACALMFMGVWFLGTLRPVTFGLLILCGRCTVELTRDWLRAVDSAGPFRKARRARREDIERFSVDVANERNLPSFLAVLRSLGGLEAHVGTAKAMPVAIGYPKEWLTALGDELTRHINESNVIESHAPLPATEEVVKRLSSDQDTSVASEEVAVQPRTSQVRLEETADSVTLAIPPAGLRGSKGMFSFGIVWCGFIAVFTGVFLFTGKKDLGIIAPVLLFLSLFWTVGLAFLIAAINMARRRALFVATPNELRIAQENLFGKKAWSWARADLASVVVGKSGVEVNSRPLLELQVYFQNGNKSGFLGGRDEAELQWVAGALRRKLNLAAR
jgi:hypothetical protein